MFDTHTRTSVFAALLALLTHADAGAFAVPPDAKPVDAKYRVWGGPMAWYVPAAAYGTPVWTWLANDTLLIHVPIISSSTSVPDSRAGTAFIVGSHVFVCYMLRQPAHVANQPIASAAFPSVLEYTIQGIIQDSKLTVVARADCK